MANPHIPAGHILTRTTAPDPLLTLAEAKAHLRVDFADDDTLITALVASVTAALDGIDGMYGYPVTTQRWALSVAKVDGPLYLPVTPAQNLWSLTYWPASGGAQVTANNADYRLIANETWAYVEPVSLTWPALANRADALTVTWTAGYSEVPADVKHAARLMLAYYYDNRAGEAPDDTALQSLVSLRRRWWLS